VIVWGAREGKHGDDMPEIAGWRWGQQEKAGGPRVADTGGDNV
jgi:xylulose-5-phosphate/fructose-6-phosphate phosphoketolase